MPNVGKQVRVNVKVAHDLHLRAERENGGTAQTNSQPQRWKGRFFSTKFRPFCPLKYLVNILKKIGWTGKDKNSFPHGLNPRTSLSRFSNYV